MLHRRHVILGGLCACCLPVRRARASSFTLREIAPGIHVRRGLDEEASPGNADAIANAGFIIGRESVLVFDPGGSLADGAAREWKFAPVDEQGNRVWVLTFAFTREGVTARATAV